MQLIDIRDLNPGPGLGAMARAFHALMALRKAFKKQGVFAVIMHREQLGQPEFADFLAYNGTQTLSSRDLARMEQDLGSADAACSGCISKRDYLSSDLVEYYTTASGQASLVCPKDDPDLLLLVFANCLMVYQDHGDQALYEFGNREKQRRSH